MRTIITLAIVAVVLLLVTIGGKNERIKRGHEISVEQSRSMQQAEMLRGRIGEQARR